MPNPPKALPEIFDRVSIPVAYRMGYLTNNYREPSFRAIEASYGLTRPETLALIYLAARDGATATDICEDSGHLRTNISRAVNALHRKRLIRRQVAGDDQRRHLLFVTEQGLALHRAFMAQLEERERAMMRCLSPAERERLGALLDKMCRHVPDWRSDAIAPRACAADASERDGAAPGLDGEAPGRGSDR